MPLGEVVLQGEIFFGRGYVEIADGFPVAGFFFKEGQEGKRDGAVESTLGGAFAKSFAVLLVVACEILGGEFFARVDDFINVVLERVPVVLPVGVGWVVFPGFAHTPHRVE